jgi:hypothetical protein
VIRYRYIPDFALCFFLCEVVAWPVVAWLSLPLTKADGLRDASFDETDRLGCGLMLSP